MTRAWITAVVALVAIAIAAPDAQHRRLFPPEELTQLEGPDRDAWQRPDQIMDALGIGEGTIVADLGAGGGWFTVRLARQVGPNGLVYAEDIQPEMIRAIGRRVQREGLQKVTTVLGNADDPKLPPRAVDAVLMVDVYHEVERPGTLLRNVAAALKPAGVIGIVEFKRDGGGPGPAMSVRVDPEKVIADARAVGLELRKRENFLRYQYMLTFGLAPVARPASK
jgi:ubiquinone/menaquinone biosynthesis C-methylase UbiE